MKVSSQQAMFLPWAGYWNKLLQVDSMVLVGGVALSPRDYIHRMQLQGSWVGVLLKDKGAGKTIIEHVVYSADKPVERIVRELMVKRYRYHYRLDPILAILSEVVPGETTLFQLNCRLTEYIASKIRYSGSFKYDTEPRIGSDKTEKLGNMLKGMYTEPFTYYCGSGALNYLFMEKFGHPLRIQKVVVPDYESIVVALAREPDIVDYVNSFARWEE